MQCDAACHILPRFPPPPSTSASTTYCTTLQHIDIPLSYFSAGNSVSSFMPFLPPPLQHTTTYSKIQQYTATHCNSLQHTAAHCNTRQHTTTHCNTLTYPPDTPAWVIIFPPPLRLALPLLPQVLHSHRFRQSRPQPRGWGVSTQSRARNLKRKTLRP